MTGQNERRWFIKSSDVFTDQVVCEALKSRDQAAETTIIVVDRKPLVVWEVDCELIRYLQRSQSQIATKFDVFMKVGDIIQRFELYKHWGPKKKKEKPPEKQLPYKKRLSQKRR